MNYNIEKNIPYTRVVSKEDLPLDKMEPGDSILLAKKADKSIYARFYNRVQTLKKKMGIKAHFRFGKDPKTGEGLRLWKLAA